MTGIAVNVGLGTALAAVASVAVTRLLPRRVRRPTVSQQRIDALVHLAMASGMAAMLTPVTPVTPVTLEVRVTLELGFGALAAGLLAGGVAALVNPRGRAAGRAGHRLHHVATSCIMVLMANGSRLNSATSRTGQPAMTHMTMTPPGGHGASLPLLAAFCYAMVSACTYTWRMQARTGYGEQRGPRPCGADPLGHGCEVVMLLSTAVMLLPVI
ncbi:DUF5134 domain-containing protein [Actinocrinis puniceicyclus]|uniref:DUF5134 domain-containing protein n=1 Tax=Actinocrinis puniceicyclus TaxID=977794 RepID=A0A8J7WVM0_9ACTN|nr:DUF5134 domain-containing protein [Actinocrinis puniceicyclus]MBS2966707.1 DUF5134 domain-containing protein [Actinocrinis puniceicyclus]